jgi:hypothetical protein
MKIIDFTSGQIETKDLPAKEDFYRHFLQEYGRLCNISDEALNQKTELQIKQTDKEILEITLQKVRDILKRSEDKILNFSGDIEIPPVILFIGPVAWDGHGIIVKEKSYIFLNLTMMEHHFNMSGFIPEVHAVHEIIHGIHYNLFPEFYPGNCKTIKELYFNKFLAEGIATYLSGKINNSASGEALSFGFMTDEDFNIWGKTCESLKNQSGLLVKKSVSKNLYNDDLWRTLFFVPDLEPGCLTRGRFGYYYGMKITEIAAEKTGDISLVKTSHEDLYPFVEDYFSETER